MTKIILHHENRWSCSRIAAVWVLLGCAALVVSPCALAQADSAQNDTRNGGDGGLFGGQPPVSGTVTVLAADHVTVKTEAGDIYQIFMGPNTQIRKDRQPVKLTDVQTGDLLTAAGEVDAAARTVHAAFALDISAEQVKKLREGLGKQWISGKVTAIEDTTLTIQRIDNVTQKIEVDESTSFRKGRGGMGGMGMGTVNGQPPANQPPAGESITLADIKVGDNVVGQGALKNNVFVPVMLAVMTPGARGQRHNGNPNSGKPSTGSPTPAPPP